MEALVARVDQLVLHVFERWGDAPQYSDVCTDLILELQSLMAEAGSAGDEELRRKCPRLRLLALTIKILTLLSSRQGPKLSAVVHSWAAQVRHLQSQAAYEKLVTDMRSIRDVADVCDKASGASSASITKEVLDSAKHLNSVLVRLGAEASRGTAAPVAVGATVAPPAGPQRADSRGDAAVSSQAQQKRHISPQKGGSLLKRTRAASDVPADDGLSTLLAAPSCGGGGGSSSSSSRAAVQEPQHPPAEKLSQPLMVEESPASGEVPQGKPAEYDIFLAPLLDEMADQGVAKASAAPQGLAPVQRVARSAAPGDPDESEAFRGDVPARIRHYLPWTTAEETRLQAGFAKYGKSWETIRTTQGLKHRTGSQIRDKWRSLSRLF